MIRRYISIDDMEIKDKEKLLKSLLFSTFLGTMIIGVFIAQSVPLTLPMLVILTLTLLISAYVGYRNWIHFEKMEKVRKRLKERIS